MTGFLVGCLAGLICGVFIGANVGATDNTFKIAKQKVRGSGRANFNNNLEAKEKRGIFGFLKRKKKKL